jgi:hypothetical protein
MMNQAIQESNEPTSTCPYCDQEFSFKEDLTCRCQRAIGAAQWLVDNGVVASHPLLG